LRTTIKVISIIAIIASIVWIGFYVSDLVESKNTTEEIRELYSKLPVESSTPEPSSSPSPEPSLVPETSEEPVENEPAEEEVPVDTTGYVIELRRNPNSELLAINHDFTGWIKVGGTAVDYPIVKHSDNDYYLDKDFYGNENIAGSIYMDYRNFGNELDGNIILYGHNMKNGTMFNSLNDYKDREFFDENTTITFSNLYNTYEYEIFSVYWVSANDYELKVDFKNSDLKEYYEELSEKSLFQRKIDIDDITQIITLATCSYEVDNGRLMIHGILKSN